jgi:predicted cupin superfamily sugar epimerase
MNNTEQNAAYWTDLLNLQPHPEGGFYRETFRSAMQVTTVDTKRVKQACTSIYYLLESGDFSAFHRLGSDEIWYFHQGTPLTIYVIDAVDPLQSIELSDQPTGSLSVCIKAGCWFAATPVQAGGYTLVSCAVAPGFEFDEFEMANREKLIAAYPDHEVIISRFCRD